MAVNLKDVPVVILAGGLGTRLGDETESKPKPLVAIGDRPVIQHVVDYYRDFGAKHFIVCGGYRVAALASYFANQSRSGVEVLDTGLNTQTGGRLLRALEHLDEVDCEHIAVTYSDGLTDADLAAEFAFHGAHGGCATLLGVHPPSRFGLLSAGPEGRVLRFREKPPLTDYVNGGYLFLRRRLAQAIAAAAPERDALVLESGVLDALADANELYMFRHEGFWQCMDYKQELDLLNRLYAEGRAPWLVRRTSAGEQDRSTGHAASTGFCAYRNPLPVPDR